MRKIYISILAFFAVFTASAQYTPMTGFGYQFKRIVVDSTLQIPSFCGVPTLRNSTLKNGGIAIDTCNNKLYKYTRANGWSEVGGGAGGNFIDSLKRSNDSIFARKNGVWTFQYKDSIGGGGGSQNLQQVTDQGATTTNTITIDDGSRAMAIYEKNLTFSNYNLLRYHDPLLGDIFTLYDSSSANSGGMKYYNYGSNNSFELSVNSYDKYKLYLDNGDHSIDIVDNKIEVNNSNTIETIIPVTNQSGLNDTTYFPVNDMNKDTLATMRNVRNSTIDTTGAFLISVSQPNDSTLSFKKGATTTSYTIRSSVAGSATRLVTSVYNNSGSTIPKGSVIYINGRHSSNLPTIALARANNEANSYTTFALVENDIANNNSGIVIQAGNITNLNLPTSSYTDGQVLYLSPTVAGGYTTTKPLAPNHIVKLGTVTRAHPTFGTIELKIENGWQLDELSDVAIPAVPNDSNILQFFRIDSLWRSVSITSAIGNRYIRPSDTATMLTNYAKNSQVNVKLNISDTATMLTPYLRKVDTASLSNRINTKLNISDTTAFDRKSAAAYTFRANGTNATANMSDFTFRDTSGVYTGSILWNGTAPSGATNHYYQWQQIGKMVKLQIVLSYATVGSATSQVTMALPSDCPAPALPAFNAGALSILYQGFGLVALNTTSTTAFASGGAGLRRNSADNGNELFINFASTGPRVARLEVTYRAQ